MNTYLNILKISRAEFLFNLFKKIKKKKKTEIKYWGSKKKKKQLFAASPLEKYYKRRTFYLRNESNPHAGENVFGEETWTWILEY